jgi:hypothetical protein
MASELSLSLSNATLSVAALLGVVLYAGFAYLVAHSKDMEVRRRWRYSILWTISPNILSFIIGLVIVFGVDLYVDESNSGVYSLNQISKNLIDISTGIILMLPSIVLILLFIIFLLTLATYMRERNSGDLNINRILCPAYKHPSDQSPDSIFERIRIFIAKLID